jgi:nitrile hydratase
MAAPTLAEVDDDPPAPAYAAEGEALRFVPGQVVRVRRSRATGHIRTPFYLRGKTGVVERICGHFGNPEELAYNRTGGQIALYRVRFTMAEVWGARAERPHDTLDAEIFDHWLEAV